MGRPEACPRGGTRTGCTYFSSATTFVAVGAGKVVAELHQLVAGLARFRQLRTLAAEDSVDQCVVGNLQTLLAAGELGVAGAALQEALDADLAVVGVEDGFE